MPRNRSENPSFTSSADPTFASSAVNYAVQDGAPPPSPTSWVSTCHTCRTRYRSVTNRNQPCPNCGGAMREFHPSGALWGQEWATVATMARLWNRIHHLELEALPAGWPR